MFLASSASKVYSQIRVNKSHDPRAAAVYIEYSNVELSKTPAPNSMTPTHLPPTVWPQENVPQDKISSGSVESPVQNNEKSTIKKPKLGKKTLSPTRLPPPALFQGPPSGNASNISLHVPGSSSAAATAAGGIGVPHPASITTTATTSSREHRQRISARLRADLNNGDPSPGGVSGAKVGATSAFARNHSTDANAKRENDHADALWVEMQNTLAEVELSAANDSHIFGAGHAKALEDLRTAQLELAQAWAKSEGDEVASHAARDVAEERNPMMGAGNGGSGNNENDGRSGSKKQQQQQQRQRSGSVDSIGSEKARKTLEEETENDILLAKRRREANDRYFDQVNSAVLDVVKKLDDVAGAMRRVEKQSNDIWSEDGDGSQADSVTATSTTDG